MMFLNPCLFRLCAGLEENTIVYFTSDHGAPLELGSRGGSNAPFRGGKSNAALEGGIRVPGEKLVIICKLETLFGCDFQFF
jgi:hypothetical protein